LFNKCCIGFGVGCLSGALLSVPHGSNRISTNGEAIVEKLDAKSPPSGDELSEEQKAN